MTPTQQRTAQIRQLILDNYKNISINQISKMAKISYQKCYYQATAMGLIDECIFNEYAHAKRKHKATPKGYFNVDLPQDYTWIV